MMHEVKQPLCIENGKFMRGNEEVKPVIGDREQIECLQSAEREYNAAYERAISGDIECECKPENIQYTSTIEFECICGEDIKDDQSGTADDWEELDSCEFDWDNNVVVCSHCGREYRIQAGYAKLIER